MTPKIHIFGGGTFSHVRPHLALSAPAFGQTARVLRDLCANSFPDWEVVLHLTKMADCKSLLVTNEDVATRLGEVVGDPATKVIIMTAALCDYHGSILAGGERTPSGKREPRLQSREGEQIMSLIPAEKILGRVRRDALRIPRSR